jgi:hypothetical protein
MAITAATFQEYDQNGVDTYRVRLRLTDPTRTPTTFDDWFTVKGNTLAELRDDASRQIAARNAALASRDLLAGIAVGFVIPVTPPAAAQAPAPTAAQVWADKARRLAALRAMGTIANGALLTAINALQTDVQNTYVAGHLDAV